MGFGVSKTDLCSFHGASIDALRNHSDVSHSIPHKRVLHINAGTVLGRTSIMSNQNITLSLPADVLRQAKIIAAKRRMSVSGLLREMLQELVDRETGWEEARHEFTKLAQDGFDLGSAGEIAWAREELHER